MHVQKQDPIQPDPRGQQQLHYLIPEQRGRSRAQQPQLWLPTPAHVPVAIQDVACGPERSEVILGTSCLSGGQPPLGKWDWSTKNGKF